MTHPPAGPYTPKPPAGPRVPKVQPIDPDSPGGRAAAESFTQALAEILVAVWQRRAAAKRAAEAS